MAATRLSEVERAYFVRKVSGAPASEPFNNIRRRYIGSQVSIGPQEKIESIENKWLLKIITDGGDTPSGNDNGTLWREAVVAIGETPSRYVNDNKIIFYINAA